jgi:hypothetical protein
MVRDHDLSKRDDEVDKDVGTTSCRLVSLCTNTAFLYEYHNTNDITAEDIQQSRVVTVIILNTWLQVVRKKLHEAVMCPASSHMKW